jgi:tripartite-type tricarboxylate transporter receptor subunit TctC
MTKPTRRRLLGLAAAVGALCTAPFLGTGAQAQSWPTRPVRVIVPFAPGGVTDVIARLVAGKLSEQMGRSFYVENVVGGSGNVGMAQGAKAPADGYTILTAFSSYVINPSLFDRLAFDPIKDFDPISLAVTSTTVIVVNPAVQASNIGELIALVRTNPGKFSYASAGTGTTSHLAGEQFRLALGLDIVHVPFTGGAPAVASVVAGHTQIGMGNPITAVPLIHDGQIRALAVTSKTRTPTLPEVPTMTEGGYPEIAGDNFVGFVVPIGTPKDIVGLLNNEMVKAVTAPDMRERLAMLGYDPVGSTPEEFGQRIRAEIATWAKVIKAANIRPQ